MQLIALTVLVPVVWVNGVMNSCYVLAFWSDELDSSNDTSSNTDYWME